MKKKKDIPKKPTGAALAIAELVEHRLQLAIDGLNIPKLVYDQVQAQINPPMVATVAQAPAHSIPHWKCHKVVRAFKIGGVVDGKLFAEERNVPVVTMSPGYHEKHKPQAGGYYVIYEDGYESFSPAQAFEAGYSRIE